MAKRELDVHSMYVFSSILWRGLIAVGSWVVLIVSGGREKTVEAVMVSVIVSLSREEKKGRKKGRKTRAQASIIH